MSRHRDQRVQRIRQLVENPGETFSTDFATIFDDQSIDLIFDGREAKHMPALTREMFVPRGMTPLNDAIGSTVQKIEKVERHKDEGVAFVILTDGLENASKEFSRDAVRKLLERVQKENNWLVIYLGANQDAFAEGATRGVAASHTMDFQPAMMPSVMRAAARMARVYAENPAAPSDFTVEERRAAMGRK